jgi:hypothetical protein
VFSQIIRGRKYEKERRVREMGIFTYHVRGGGGYDIWSERGVEDIIRFQRMIFMRAKLNDLLFSVQHPDV